MQNVFDSVDYASGFKKSVDSATESMKQAISNTKAQLSDID